MSVAEIPESGDGLIRLSDEEISVLSSYEKSAYTAYLQRHIYKRDPVIWGNDKLKEKWWSKQREIIYALQIHRKVAVRSCHEAGKDFIAARAACHWLDTGTPGARAVVTTATTGDQVKAIMWKEINQAHKKGNLVGRVNMTEWLINNEIVGIGRKVADYEPTSFHGMHAPEGVLVIYDEACGIVEELFQAGNSMAGNEASRQLAIGNPDDPQSYFAKLFLPESNWHQIHIDGYETPNFTDEKNELPPEVLHSLLEQSYVDDLRDEYGEDSPIFVSKVRGNFPSDAKDGVVPWSRLQQCRFVEVNEEGPVELGLDVGASTGGDATVIRERRGNKACREWTIQTDDSEQIVGLAVQAIHETGATKIKIDVIGVGFGVAGHLEALRKEGVHNCKIVRVNVSESSSNPSRFPNLRSQIWWEVAREATMALSWALGDVDDKTMAELIAPRYSINARGLTVIEPKAETKKRIGKSPDHGDALNLAFYVPVNSGKGRTSGQLLANSRLNI